MPTQGRGALIAHGAERPLSECPSAPDRAANAASNSERGSGSRRTKKGCEDKLVKQREIQHFKLPLLSNNAAEQRGWLNSFLAYMSRFDATASESFIWKWTNKSFQVGLKQKHVGDIEGCTHLDACIASDI